MQTKQFYRSRSGLVLLPMLLFLTTTPDLLAQESRVQPAIFDEGANCLFIGHSFFIPVARSFDKIATQNDFKTHEADFVFSPGPSGSPGALWSNPKRREQIEAKLSGGQIELLGMTVGKANESLEDYQRWIDLALKYNPKTRFFIGKCWLPAGPKMDTAKYDKVTELSGRRFIEIVNRLSEANPQQQIYFIDYGKTTSVMKALFDRGELDDIDQFVDRGKNSLFRDGVIGHGGAMMVELSALSWIELLYGAEAKDLQHTPYNKADFKRIIAEVVLYNQGLRELNKQR